jgi:hypothetical protein
MEEYLTVDELTARIKYSRQSLYNLIHRGTLIRGIHFVKPTPKKILFKWSAIQVWMGDKEEVATEPAMKKAPDDHDTPQPVHPKPNNLIRIN